MSEPGRGTDVASPPDADFRLLFEGVPGRFLVIDAATSLIVAASDEYLASMGHTHETAFGFTVPDIFISNPEDPDADEQKRRFIESIERVRRNRTADSMPLLRFDLPDGDGSFREHYWSCVNSPVFDAHGQIKYIVHRVEDVTDFIRMDPTSLFSDNGNQSVDDQIARLGAEALARTEELERVRLELLAARDAKNEFLSRVNHELRTPLTSIMGFADLLAISEIGEDEQEWVETIRRAGRHLLAIVDEVIDLSRLESGRLSFSLEPVTLSNLIDEVVQIARPLAAARDIAINVGDIDDELYVCADNQRLKQVLINVISNAVKYNREGGKIAIVVEPTGVDHISLSVADTGAGIDAAKIDKLFEPFERLGADTGTIEGTGLGMAVSKQLLDAMGGSIAVTKSDETGTTFTITVPRTDMTAVGDEEIDADEVLEVQPSLKARSVLYVEDTTANMRLVEAILKRRPGVRMIPAMLGGLGINLAIAHRPDLILLDLHLPDISGREVLARLKALPETSDIPVVVLSADLTRGVGNELVEQGAAAFMTKPIDVERLLRIVDTQLAGG